VLQYDDVEIVAADDNDWFDKLEWRPKWGTSSDAVAADMRMRWDHVVIRGATERVDLGTSPVVTDPIAPAVASVTISPDSASAGVGATAQFRATARDASGAEVSGQTVIWTSTDNTVATVSASGLATGIKAGTVRVIADVGGARDSATLVVDGSIGPTLPADTVPRAGHYVAPNGTSSGAGTRESPWSLTYALGGAGGKIEPGDTVWVRGGTYSSWYRIDQAQSGSSGAPITWSGYPGEKALIKGQFRISANYVVVQNLIFEGPLDGVANQVMIKDAHHVVFTRNEVRHSNANAGISANTVHHLTISSNYIHHNGVDTQHDHGIYFQTTSGVGNLITNNLLVQNAARGVSLHDNSGVGVFDVVITHNTIVGNGSVGILLNEGDRNTAANNVVVGNGDARNYGQIRIRPSTVSPGTNNRVYNNLTWHPTDPSRAGIMNETSNPAVVSGNVIANPRFVSYLTDFRLQLGSPAISLGLSNFGQTVDYEGKPRDSSPDAGAYELR
jgi:parallel beta-helix repeat protein